MNTTILAGIASRASRIHVTEEIACTRPQTPHRKRRRTRIYARLMPKRREVRAAPEIWIVWSEGQESKSPVQPRRTLQKCLDLMRPNLESSAQPLISQLKRRSSCRHLQVLKAIHSIR